MVGTAVNLKPGLRLAHWWSWPISIGIPADIYWFALHEVSCRGGHGFVRQIVFPFHPLINHPFSYLEPLKCTSIGVDNPFSDTTISLYHGLRSSKIPCSWRRIISYWVKSAMFGKACSSTALMKTLTEARMGHWGYPWNCHICGNEHQFISYIRVSRVPGFWRK